MTNRGLVVLLCVTACLAGCVSARTTTIDQQLDFYNGSTYKDHRIFAEALQLFSNHKGYRKSAADLLQWVKGKDRWIIVQRLSPGNGRYELAAVGQERAGENWFLKKDNWQGLVSEKKFSPDLDERINDLIWKDSPQTSQESDDMWLFDYSVVYITMCCKGHKPVRLAIANPGFEEVHPYSKSGSIQYELSLTPKYIELSEYAKRVISVIDRN